jgi:hypothetical protein
MKTTTKNTGIKVTAGVKAGSMPWANHNAVGLKVRTAIKAGTTICWKNHNTRMFALV